MSNAATSAAASIQFPHAANSRTSMKYKKQAGVMRMWFLSPLRLWHAVRVVLLRRHESTLKNCRRMCITDERPLFLQRRNFHFSVVLSLMREKTPSRKGCDEWRVCRSAHLRVPRTRNGPSLRAWLSLLHNFLPPRRVDATLQNIPMQLVVSTDNTERIVGN